MNKSKTDSKSSQHIENENTDDPTADVTEHEGLDESELSEKLKKKLEKLQKEDPNIYPVF